MNPRLAYLPNVPETAAPPCGTKPGTRVLARIAPTASSPFPTLVASVPRRSALHMPHLLRSGRHVFSLRSGPPNQREDTQGRLTVSL